MRERVGADRHCMAILSEVENCTSKENFTLMEIVLAMWNIRC